MPISREQVVQAAEKLVARGKVEQAIKEYQKVLGEAPRDTSTLNRIGDLWLRLERVDEARRIFTQTAEAFVDDGFLVKAIAIYKKIIKYDPTGLETYEKLADLYHRQGLVNEARSQYQVLADYYMKHGSAAKSTAILRQMIQLEADNPWPRAKLAEIHQQLGALDEALAEHRTIAELMLAQGHADEAAKVLFNGLSVDATDSGYIEWAVKALNQAGQAGNAARLLATAIERNPAAIEIATRLGLDRGRGAAARPATPFPRPAGSVTPLPVARPPAAAPVSADETLPALPPLQSLTAPPIDTDAIPLVNFDEIELEGEGFESPAPAPAPAAPMVAAGEELELDLEEEVLIPWQSMADLDALPSGTTPPPASAALAATGAPSQGATETPVQLDPDLLESTAAEVEESMERQEDLVAEAEVYSKYGLRARALERLREALKRNPANVDAYRVLVQMHLEQGRNDRVLEVVRQMQTSVPGLAGTEVWRQIRQRLLKLGYQVRGTTVSAPAPGEDESGAHEVKSLISEVLGGSAPGAGRKRGAAKPAAAPAQAPEPPPLAPPPQSIEEEDVRPEVAARPVAPPVRRPSAVKKSPAEELFDDTAVYFLDLAEDLELQAAQAPPPSALPTPTAPAAAAALFSDEDQFFDLAAELERELAEAERTVGQSLPAEVKEQTLEEIVEGFKRGVAEVLSKEDYETHFNLGIAYREMGLLDEAIGEFQLSAKSPSLILDSCSLLGICFLDKGLPELAVKWYRRGLELPGLTEPQHMAMLYDLGSAMAHGGDRDAARNTFVELYGINSNYRDVVARLAELRR